MMTYNDLEAIRSSVLTITIGPPANESGTSLMSFEEWSVQYWPENFWTADSSKAREVVRKIEQVIQRHSQILQRKGSDLLQTGSSGLRYIVMLESSSAEVLLEDLAQKLTELQTEATANPTLADQIVSKSSNSEYDFEISIEEEALIVSTGDAHSRIPIGSWDCVREKYKIDRLDCSSSSASCAYLAIVDTGVDWAFFGSWSKSSGSEFEGHGAFTDVRFDYSKSKSIAKPVKNFFKRIGSTFGSTIEPGFGEKDRSHGTVMAYDAWICAEKFTLLDIPVFPLFIDSENETKRRISRSYGFLSNVTDAYSNLHDLFKNENDPLVINNSWQIEKPSVVRRWTTNRSKVVKDVEARFTDFMDKLNQILKLNHVEVVFSAGNCGPGGSSNCDVRGEGSIIGPAALQGVWTIGAKDINDEYLTFSSVGKGRSTLDHGSNQYVTPTDKPDLLSYSHFEGAQLTRYPVDSGTSAACATFSGLLVAIWNYLCKHEKKPVSNLKDALLKDINVAHNPKEGYPGIDLIGNLLGRENNQQYFEKT